MLHQFGLIAGSQGSSSHDSSGVISRKEYRGHACARLYDGHLKCVYDFTKSLN